MDQSLWQTIKSFDILHPSHMWIQTILPCGKHCTTLHNTADQDYFKILILREALKTQNQYQVDSCRATKLDVQERGISFTQFNRNWNLFHLMQVYACMEYQLLIFGICSLKCFILHQTNQRKPKIKYEETRRVTPHQTSTPKSNRGFNPARQFWSERCWLRPVDLEIFSIWWHAVHLWG